MHPSAVRKETASEDRLPTINTVVEYSHDPSTCDHKPRKYPWSFVCNPGTLSQIAHFYVSLFQ